MSESRRNFLRRSGCALMGAGALAAHVEQFGLIHAFARAQSLSDYKALVCIFLEGGNDGNNTVVPVDDYNAAGGYASVRGASNLSLPQSSLLPLSPPSQQGRKYGLHPNLVELQTLFNQNRLAVLCNTGTLVQPLTRQLYRSGVGHPYQLFSHSDQVEQQQTCISAQPGHTGWGGRISDVMSGANGAAPLPLAISTAGTSLLMSGDDTRQLVVNPEVRLNELFRVDLGNDFSLANTEVRRIAFNRIRADATAKLSRAAAETVEQAMQAGFALSLDPVLPPLQAGQTDFQTTPLGKQLKQVAKIISLRAQLGVRRQIFFCSLGGFDHHNNQRTAANSHDALLLQVSKALKAFHDATVNLGVAAEVTTFTLSDFGRTFEPSGTGAGVGTDHAWGNHQFIMGGAVRGGDFYGTFPTLALGGPDDADERGRWIPTTSTEQYAATLGLWFGLPHASLPAVFPLLGRFPASNLGFMS
jgi:uncharacterized protein (DUF1501 family)